MNKFILASFDMIPDEEISIAVVAARYKGKWVLCRHKQRETWEFPGGHRETSESIESAARRELYEETGAREYSLSAVTAVRDQKYTGIVYFAEISAFDPILENSEMAETKLFEYLPENLTYPRLYKVIFDRVQGWLNIQSNAGEIWDVYDKDRNKTGKFHRRGDPLNEGEYHLVVHVWMKNSLGEYLITKRAPNKGFPNMWETTGGSALQGDDSLTAALREVKEETGLSLDPANGKCVLSYCHSDCFTDVWLFEQDFSLTDVVLQEGETTDKMYASKDSIKAFIKKGTFVPYSYISELFENTQTSGENL